MPPLPQRAREMFDGRNFATVATLQPDGQPQTSVVWVRADGDDVVFSTIKGRRKYENLTRDPRVSVLIFDAADPYSYAEIRGIAQITDDPAAELIDELSRKYTGRPFGERPGEQRVIVRVRPDHVVSYV
jgi:PPOX class probable F420-dependent enzyme